MKNLLLLCLLFFAFQNVLSAQSDFGVLLGGGVYNQDYTTDNKSDFTPQLKTGFSYQRNIAKDKFQLSTALNFHYFNKIKRTFSYALTEQSIIGNNNPLDDAVLNNYNSRLTYRKTHFAVSLPVILSVNLKRLSIGTGSEFQFKTVDPQIGFSYLTRLQYRISERFSISANYVRSLLNENREFENYDKAKTQRIETSIRYCLIKE